MTYIKTKKSIQRKLTYKEMKDFGGMSMKLMRMATGMCVEDLAFHTGVSTSKMNRWLATPKSISIGDLVSFVDAVNKIAPATKCTYDELFHAILMDE
jgi:hypothetical protein